MTMKHSVCMHGGDLPGQGDILDGLEARLPKGPAAAHTDLVAGADSVFQPDDDIPLADLLDGGGKRYNATAGLTGGDLPGWDGTVRGLGAFLPKAAPPKG